MRPARRLALALATAAALAGCTSDKAAPQPAPGPAAALTYVDPPASAGWRLVRAASSTSTRLVLALVGPAGTQVRGAGFNLKAPPGVAFDAFDDGWPLRDTGVLELRNTRPADPGLPPDPLEPVYKAGGVLPGNVLTVGLFQKDRSAAAHDAGAPLLEIAVTLRTGASATPAGPVALEVVKARVMPGDLGLLGNFSEMLARSHLQPVTISVGTLTAN